MKNCWIHAKHTNWGLSFYESWRETEWNIRKNGQYLVINKYGFGCDFIRGQLSSKEIQKLSDQIDSIREWYTHLPQDEFPGLHGCCDGSVWSLSIRSGKKSFSYSNAYTYNVSDIKSMENFLTGLNKIKKREQFPLGLYRTPDQIHDL